VGRTDAIDPISDINDLNIYAASGRAFSACWPVSGWNASSIRGRIFWVQQSNWSILNVLSSAELANPF